MSKKRKRKRMTTLALFMGATVQVRDTKALRRQLDRVAREWRPKPPEHAINGCIRIPVTASVTGMADARTETVVGAVDRVLPDGPRGEHNVRVTPFTTADPAAQAGRPCHDDADPGVRLVALAQYMAQDRRDVIEAMDANRNEADELRIGIELAIAELSDAQFGAGKAFRARKLLQTALIRAGLREPEEDDDARD